MPSENIFAIIPCAGKGLRAGLGMPKQYRKIMGSSLLHHVLTCFNACKDIKSILLALAPDENYFDANHYSELNFHLRYCGGANRLQTVMNALNELKPLGVKENDWVLVHDAARPGIKVDLIQRLIDRVKTDTVGGLLAIPIADTIKKAAPATVLALNNCRQSEKHRVNAECNIDKLNINELNSTKARNQSVQKNKLYLSNKINLKLDNQHTTIAITSDSAQMVNNSNHCLPYRVEKTIDRNNLWLAQTPQMFRFGMLHQALNQALIDSQIQNISITDEASAIERLGLQPILVTGCMSNFKITYPEDFEMLEKLLQLNTPN